jgi:hypothetical protein
MTYADGVCVTCARHAHKQSADQLVFGFFQALSGANSQVGINAIIYIMSSNGILGLPQDLQVVRVVHDAEDVAERVDD